MYYFNTESGQCEQFVYGGCEGNANRFSSMEECQGMCASLMNNKQDCEFKKNCLIVNLEQLKIMEILLLCYHVMLCLRTFVISQCFACNIADDLIMVGGCQGTQHGCCPDMETAAEGPGYLGCPASDTVAEGACLESEFGCCLDGMTAATGHFNEGCPEFTCRVSIQ